MNSAASAQQMHGGRTQASAQRARKGKLKLFGGSIARNARRNAGLPPLMGCTYATKRILATLTLTLTTSSSPSTYARDTGAGATHWTAVQSSGEDYTRKEKLEAWEVCVAFEEQQRGEDGRSGALNLALTVAHLAEADLVGGGLGTEEPSDDHEMNVSRPNRDPKPELVTEPNPDASGLERGGGGGRGGGGRGSDG